jgi:alpha-L-rhamnosidase
LTAQAVSRHYQRFSDSLPIPTSRPDRIIAVDNGDWLNADTFVHCSHLEGRAAVPKEVLATAFFAHSAKIVSAMAGVLGLGQHEQTYAALFENIKAAFNKAYVSTDGRIHGNTQAGYALALHFDLLPEELRPKAARYLVESLALRDGHLSTGIQTTHRLMLELTRTGNSDEAYRLISLRDFPSWAFMIDNGATTIWERWDGYVKGRGFQDFNMNSFNHWALGAVGEWMWRAIIGINPDDSGPGFKRFIVRPQPGGSLTWARGTYRSIRGLISCEWKIDEELFTLDINVLPNTTAVVHIPASGIDQVMECGTPAANRSDLTYLGRQDGAEVFEAASGHYRFVANR